MVDESVYASWFHLDTSDSHHECDIKNYEILDDNDLPFSHPKVQWINTDGNHSLIIDTSEPFDQVTLHLFAHTHGLVNISREIHIEVCGGEQISVTDGFNDLLVKAFLPN